MRLTIIQNFGSEPINFFGVFMSSAEKGNARNRGNLFSHFSRTPRAFATARAAEEFKLRVFEEVVVF
jgi:hypothetical protein